MSARVRVLALALGVLASAPALAAGPMPGTSGGGATARRQPPTSATSADRSRSRRGGAGSRSPPACWSSPRWRRLVVTTLRRRRRRPLEPHELALKRLDEAQPLVEEGLARAYALTASEAVREYIEARFGLRAAHATTEEFFADLMRPDASQLGEHRKELAEFLGACDLVKFARFELPPEGLATMNELARSFVLATVPGKEPAPPQPARTS